MGQLIDDLLSLSQVSLIEMRCGRINLSALGNDILLELSGAEPERQVESVVAPDLKAEGDASLLRAVLQNFVSNAWKYSSRRPKARIEFGSVDRDGERVFFIRDDGAGFDMAYSDKLFAPFQRLHDATEYPGTGIGLAVSKRIVERHGGRIWIDPQHGSGARICFSLPR